MKKIIIILCFCILPVAAFAKHIHPEKYYQEKWCAENGGKTEVVFDDQSRCDCLIEDEGYAVEVDFAAKWAESIGQALHYAAKTEKTPGILLIIEQESDWKYHKMVLDLINYHKLNIKVWVTGP